MRTKRKSKRLTKKRYHKKKKSKVLKRSGSFIFISKSLVKKRFNKSPKGRMKFERELSIYKKKLNYIPRLVSYNPKLLEIVMKNVGVSLLDKYRPKDRKKYLEDMKKLHKRFLKDTGYYHNDVRYQNTLEDKNGKLYFIDFEKIDRKLKDSFNYKYARKLY